MEVSATLFRKVITVFAVVCVFDTTCTNKAEKTPASLIGICASASVLRILVVPLLRAPAIATYLVSASFIVDEPADVTIRDFAI
jgi:hypothetical protein